MPRGNAQHRMWSICRNNPVEADRFDNRLADVMEGVQYAVWQLERGEAEGTPHFQGFVMFKGRGRRQNGVRSLFPGANVEPCYGSAAQNRAYCTKESTREEGPWEIGEFPENAGQGRRSDLMAVKRAIDEGATIEDLWQSHFAQCVRYEPAFKKYRAMQMGRRDWQTKVEVYYGEAGSGKTKLVRKLASELCVAEGRDPSAFYTLTRAMLGRNNVWWNGYDGESVVIIEEFEGWLLRDYFKNIVNTSDLLVQTKGGDVRFLAKTILITSNHPPNRWWKMDDPLWRQKWPEVARRLSSPIGKVYRVCRNPDVEASEEVFHENFSIIEEDPSAIELPEPIIPPNVFHVNADANV